MDQEGSPHNFDLEADGISERISFSSADQHCLALALHNPPTLAPALDRAFVRRSQLLRHPLLPEPGAINEGRG